MHYQINIATRDGKTFDGRDKFTHFAKVTIQHITEEEARARFHEFCIRFPGTWLDGIGLDWRPAGVNWVPTPAGGPGGLAWGRGLRTMGGMAETFSFPAPWPRFHPCCVIFRPGTMATLRATPSSPSTSRLDAGPPESNV